MVNSLLNRRHFLGGFFTGCIAAGSVSNIGWVIFAPVSVEEKSSADSGDVSEYNNINYSYASGEIGTSHYNSYTHFDPISRKITLYYGLKPQINPDRPWIGKSIEIDYDGPDGIFELHTDIGHRAFVLATSSVKKNPKEILVIIPDYTLHAYNRLGGGSLYTGPKWVSMDRPAVIANYHSVHANPLKFLDENNLTWDLIKQSDVDFMPGQYNLNDYRKIIIYGHDEYWTLNLRTQIENAVQNGTDLVNLSGNTCYWALDIKGRKINRDRLGRYIKSSEPEYKLLGNAFDWAGFPIKRKVHKVDKAILLDQLKKTNFPENGDSEDEILRKTDLVRTIGPTSSILHNTGLRKGDWIKGPVLGVEVDGIPLTTNGDVNLEETDGFEPDELEIGCEGWAIRTSDVKHFGFCIKSRFRKGGYVWSNSSVSWTRTLTDNNPHTRQITLNALKS